MCIMCMCVCFGQERYIAILVMVEAHEFLSSPPVGISITHPNYIKPLTKKEESQVAQYRIQLAMYEAELGLTERWTLDGQPRRAPIDQAFVRLRDSKIAGLQLSISAKAADIAAIFNNRERAWGQAQQGAEGESQKQTKAYAKMINNAQTAIREMVAQLEMWRGKVVPPAVAPAPYTEDQIKGMFHREYPWDGEEADMEASVARFALQHHRTVHEITRTDEELARLPSQALNVMRYFERRIAFLEGALQQHQAQLHGQGAAMEAMELERFKAKNQAIAGLLAEARHHARSAEVSFAKAPGLFVRAPSALPHDAAAISASALRGPADVIMASAVAVPEAIAPTGEAAHTQPITPAAFTPPAQAAHDPVPGALLAEVISDDALCAGKVPIGIHYHAAESTPLFLATAEANLFTAAMGGSMQEIAFTVNEPFLEVKRHHLQCMDAGVWLNDIVLHAHIIMLQWRDFAARQGGTDSLLSPPKCHYLPMYFFNKLFKDTNNYKYEAVSRWSSVHKLRASRQASDCILHVDRIIGIVNINDIHWVTVCADLNHKVLVYYDSVSGAWWHLIVVDACPALLH
jgi:hypothetical protein